MTSPTIDPATRRLDLRAPAPGSALEGAEPAAGELVAPALTGRSRPLVLSGGPPAADPTPGLALFHWTTPEGETISASGAVARFEASGPGRFEAAKRWLAALASVASMEEDGTEAPRLIAVGGFSFATGSAGAAAGLGDAAFFVPAVVDHAVPGRPPVRTVWKRSDPEGPPIPPFHEGAPAPLHAWTETEWTEAVRAALDRIDAGELEKVVLARAVEAGGVAPLDPWSITARLLEANPHCYRYLVRPGGRAAFLGASPERLVSLREGAVSSDAVAGTAPGEAPALLSSEKDRAEHAFVVRQIVESLRPLCASVASDDAPSLQRHRHLAHLKTRVGGEALPGTHVLDLVARVHPTPAVAGEPREPALAFLREREPAHRGWYAGPIGWMDATGDGDFAVGIRSALVDGTRALLFAGAGIVRGSDPASEWAETDMKLTVLREAIADAGR
ncbi:MAG: isochorismate synthase [Hyphomicrobiales bacterium]